MIFVSKPSDIIQKVEIVDPLGDGVVLKLLDELLENFHGVFGGVTASDLTHHLEELIGRYSSIVLRIFSLTQAEEFFLLLLLEYFEVELLAQFDFMVDSLVL